LLRRRSYSLHAAYEAAYGLHNERPDSDPPEADMQFDRLVEAVADELTPKIARLIDEALARRLPRQWPA